MSLDDGNTDEYVVTALQIFQYCGVEAGSTLRVDALMDQFAPFVKTNKAEYSYLRSLLDPEQSNPEITVSMLANSLNKYSESQKVKVDLEESFNLKNGQLPHDSDSGISTDGFQLLEELQCELREKSRLAQQLRTQLDYTDRHHEEALATVTAERDSLRAHLNMLRDENMTLTHVRRDYEDVCESLGCSEKALDESRRELECTRRRTKVLTEQVALLENEKLNLQELLATSKDECHRINDMYASRQSSLLEKNETLRAEHADLSSRMRYQEEYMQQLIKEKVVLEMEVKDMLNKSNLPVHHMERSIDVSYTEDQMLTALDSLNADSRFPQDGRLLDEESFVNALKEDQGIPTNMSLFDEIRLSFCNMSRHNTTDLNFTQPIEKPVLDDFITSSTQTDDKLYYLNENEIFKNCRCKIISDDALNVSTQTDENITGNEGNLILDTKFCLNNNRHNNNFKLVTPILENNKKSKDNVILDAQINEYNIGAKDPQTNDDIIKEKEKCFGKFFENRKQLRSLSAPNVGILKKGPNRLRLKDDNRKLETKDEATNTSFHVFEVFKDIEVMNYGTQTEENKFEHTANNNDVQVCFECTKCFECERTKKYVTKLEKDIRCSNLTITEMEVKLDQYDKNLNNLKRYVDEGDEKNNFLKAAADSLKAKLVLLEGACANQGNKIDRLFCDTCCAEIQTESEQSTVSTQVEIPCADCVKRNTPHRSIRRYLWEPLKSLFQLFAVLCFMLALWLLYGVTRRWRACRDPLPWSWLQPTDLLDLFLTIEYVSDVPM
ncbi:uncharacterized protein LOC120628884 isoform X2 [Pararge aegeria]|uniref:uncharacterized protein LOC120628884 isoform X2 n=1 Tax=Pararge aegeria TaxID=116150 RepID=UPI0019D2275A|nr:uncharacterized protein LOC120628884 isoform X2 [Pararge aegeria]